MHQTGDHSSVIDCYTEEFTAEASICYHQQEKLNQHIKRLIFLISDFNRTQSQLNESSDLLSNEFKKLGCINRWIESIEEKVSIIALTIEKISQQKKEAIRIGHNK
ncbi:hypothetical protein MDAP_000680 [Mitosporidium daphniae]